MQQPKTVTAQDFCRPYCRSVT